MGYLITSNPLSNFLKIIIPESFLQNVNLNDAYFINSNLPTNQFWFLTFASFRLINSTIPYDGFSHIGLAQSGGNSQGILETSQNPSPGIIDSDLFYCFAYNQQHSPNKLGSFTTGPRYAFTVEGTYISGNGDIELSFYYNIINI